MYIYEHGIVFEIPPTGFSLKCLAITHSPANFGFTATVIDPEGNSLNERAINILRIHPQKPRFSADYYEESDLQHCVASMLYHLDRILELYVRVTRLFEKHNPLVTEGNTGDQRIYFEVEAFFDSARRVYDTIRKVLWKHFGRGTDRWSSIFTVQKNPHLVPPEFIALLEQSLTQYGRDVKSYRDCIAHCDPLTDGGTSVWARGFVGRWGAIVRLPVNPNVADRSRYQFENGPDALSYCHSVTCHIIWLCEQLSSLEAIKKHLDHPELGVGWLKSWEENSHLHDMPRAVQELEGQEHP